MNKTAVNDKVLYNMIDFLLNSDLIETKIRLYILLTLYVKYGRKIMASNKYLADKLSVSIRSIKIALKWLKNADIIDVIVFKGNKREIIVKNVNKIVVPLDFEYDYNWLEDDGK